MFEETSFKAGEKPLQRLFKAALRQACGPFRPPQAAHFERPESHAGECLSLLAQRKAPKKG
jgi:hypothetical protein